MEGVCRAFFSVLIIAASLPNQAFAERHLVGGSQGWSESTDFKSWASGRTFRVGDQLVFKYTTGLHKVVELGGESAYKNCDVGSAVESKNSGNDVIELKKEGKRYFACGTLGHCSQGMKMKITTGSVDASSPSSSSSSSSSSHPSSSSSVCSSFAWLVSFSALSAVFWVSLC